MLFKKNHRPYNPALLLGWELNGDAERFGAPLPSGSKGILYDGDGHLMTCAPTGAGKGRGVLIPNSLLYSGPLIAVDPKGELVQVAGKLRQQLGDQLVVFDPWHVTTSRSDRLNPLDLLTLPGSTLDGDAEMLASLLSAGHQFSTDPYWTDMGTGLISGLIGHIGSAYVSSERHLGKLRDWLYHDNMDLAIAKALDQGSIKSRMVRDQLIAYLTAPPDRTRPCIRTMACSYVNALGSAEVAAILRNSTFRLKDLVDGRPLSIFLVVPPEKLESHRNLLRLLVGTLLTAIIRRPRIPPERTLLLIDECAQLGTLPALRQAITLLRGSGLQVWTIWQDMSQLKLLYPQDWQTMINNSAVVQVFGIRNNLMAKEWSELLGMDPADLLRLSPDETALCIHGEGTRVCRRPDYLTDRIFQGLYSPNPRFAGFRKGPRNGL